MHIPRFEIHLDASIPHERGATSDDVNRLLAEFEGRLRDEFGATVTIQMARTTRQSVETAGNPLEGLAKELTGAQSGGGPGQYL